MQVRNSLGSIARGLVAGALVLGSVVMATPALAHIVEVTTSLTLPEQRDSVAMKAALKEAADRIIADTIAFKPTMVALTDARMMGEKLLVRFLIADADGERMLKDLEDGMGSASPDEEEEGEAREIKV